MGPDGFGVGADTLDTAYVYIKGWFLKNQALIAVKRKEPLGTYASDFCAFLKEEAYARH